jgi:hypothetical protein
MALRRYFTFELMPGCVFMISFCLIYYIPKDYDYTKEIVPLKFHVSKRINIIKNFFADIGFNLNDSDLLRIWRLLRRKVSFTNLKRFYPL